MPSSVELFVREHRVTRRQQARPVGPDHLHDSLLASQDRRLDPGDFARADERCDSRASTLELVRDSLVEAGTETDVEERAERAENDCHHAGEDERESDPDRQPTQAPASFRRRYPTPRTVSIDARPNGRSIFSRR